MADFQWGLQMMVAGMGVVFALLVVLMVVLQVIGRLDRGPAAEGGPAALPGRDAPGAVAQDADGADASPRTPAVRILADGLDETQLAAIAIAVITHAEVRRRSAAPEARATAPGSQIFASRWVAIGRGRQQVPFQQR